MIKFEKLSAYQIGSLVNDRIVSAEEIMNYFIERIQSNDRYLNAFTYTRFDEAITEAKKLDAKIVSGGYGGVFAGAPIGLKDFLPSKKGWQNSHGGVKALIAVDDADSEFYKAAKKLGAIAIGKTNAPAFGFSGACSNALYGPTRNPFDYSRTSGGSSGGSAAAVAGGLLAFAEGGDAGGSIRIPAGWCNLFGFKASKGTVVNYCRPDGWAATHPFCCNGVLTKTVKDSAYILNEMARYDPRDPYSLPINANKDFVRLMDEDIKGKKFALTLDFGLFPVDPEVKRCVVNTALRLEDAGATVDNVIFDFKHTLDEIMYCWAWAISLDSSLQVAAWKKRGLDLIKDYSHELPEEFIKFNDIAYKADINYMKQYNKICTDILDQFENILEDYDAILSPVAICKPMKHEDGGKVKKVNGVSMNQDTSFISFGETSLVNFVGYPAASVPAGLTRDNLPVGMQVIGRQYNDEICFQVGRAIEQLQPWNEHYEISYKA